MNKLTIIKSINPNRVCKEYSKNSAGEIIKTVTANVVEGIAVTQTVETADDMVKLLSSVTNRDDLVICSGQWLNEDGQKFEVMSEAALASLLNSSVGVVPGGVIKYKDRLVSARLKRGIKPSCWVLLDADNPPGIPDEWAAMTIGERLELWEPLLPGVTQCERIELRGSSARVINGSGSNKATHAWIRVSDPEKIALLKAYLSVEMVVRGVSFKYKKMSQTVPGKVVGIESRSVFDLAVLDTGRLVFCAKPAIHMDGYSVDDAGIVVVNRGGGELDIDWIKQPTSSLVEYKKITGIDLGLSMSNDGYLSVRSTGQLTLETEITVKGITRQLQEWVATMNVGDKLRCESPFRESASEAAFIKIGDDGEPFVHDVGNGTTYNLIKVNEVARLADIDLSGMERNKNGKILASFGNLTAVFRNLNLGYDKFLETAVIKDGNSFRRFVDADYVSLAISLEQMGFASISIGNVKEAARRIFFENSYDSAVDWVNSLEWDGVERCSDLFSKYFGVDESPYESACSLYFTTAMAGRVLQGGIQADMVPVLIGAQGAGKTRGVMALAPLQDTYAEIDMGNTRDSDISRTMRGKLICELGELKGLRSRDKEWIKSWISRSFESWTPKYVEFETIMPRRCVFIGTSNEEQFLVDDTGNRRWLPLTVSRDIDVDLIKNDRNQIWAEAVYLFKLMGIAWKPAQELAIDQHKNHMVIDDVMIEKVSEYFNSPLNSGKEFHTMREICSFIGLGDNPSRTEQLRVGDTLRYMGNQKVVKKISGIAHKVWVKKQ